MRIINLSPMLPKGQLKSEKNRVASTFGFAFIGSDEGSKKGDARRKPNVKAIRKKYSAYVKLCFR